MKYFNTKSLVMRFKSLKGSLALMTSSGYSLAIGLMVNDIDDHGKFPATSRTLVVNLHDVSDVDRLRVGA